MILASEGPIPAGPLTPFLLSPLPLTSEHLADLYAGRPMPRVDALRVVAPADDGSFGARVRARLERAPELVPRGG